MPSSRMMLKMYNSFSAIVNFEELSDPSEEWELGQLIGEGTYGEVYKGFNKNTGNLSFLISYLNKCSSAPQNRCLLNLCKTHKSPNIQTPEMKTLTVNVYNLYTN